jgi:hypothetical protein
LEDWLPKTHSAIDSCREFDVEEFKADSPPPQPQGAGADEVAVAVAEFEFPKSPFEELLLC